MSPKAICALQNEQRVYSAKIGKISGRHRTNIWSVCFVPDMIQGNLQTLGLLLASPKPSEIVFTIR